MSPIEETIGLPVSLNSFKALVIYSLAKTPPPGLLTLRTSAFTESSCVAACMLSTIVSEPATPNATSPVVIAPSTLITAILLLLLTPSFLSSIVER